MGENFDRKVAIVTGAAMGIGKAVAKKLAKEGVSVALVDIDREFLDITESEIVSEGSGAVLSIPANLINVDEITQAVDRTVQEFGRLDILVNVAAVMKSIPFTGISVEEWDRVVDVNLRGSFFFMQAAAKQMISQIPSGEDSSDHAYSSNGKIVNFSSISGRRGRAVQAHYAATKAGIISLTQSAALAFAKYNINVNAIAPSVVITPMWEKNNQDKSRIFGIAADKASQDFINNIPLKRPGTGLDMAEAVMFLCSPYADYITGQTLNVDGGYEMN